MNEEYTVDVVIKVPEKVWNTIKRNGEVEWCGIEMANAVRNGIPLPKGHDRLVDTTDLHQALEAYMYGVNGIHGIIDDEVEVPTIISADKE